MGGTGNIVAKMIALANGGGSSVMGNVEPCLNLAFGKLARHLFDVDATIEGAQTGEYTLSSVLDSAPDPGLLIVIDTPEGAKGLLSLDGLMVNALVELMTGASERSVFKRARVPTQIDIALCQEFCIELLSGFSGECAKAAPDGEFASLTWVDTETEAKKLAFVLENIPMGTVSGQASFQNGLRGGAISLTLPLSIWGGRKKPKPGKKDNLWGSSLMANVMSAPLKLRADLETISLPLEDAMALCVGDVLEISPFSLSDISLVAGNGVEVFTGRLGQDNGKKAISINSADFTETGEIQPSLNTSDMANAAATSPENPIR